MAAPVVAPTIADMRAAIAAWRKAGARVGLIPTMGALHEGHLSLVRAIRARGEKAVVSIFVNPTQFGPNEDFERYPRTFEADCAKLSGLADLVFAPSVKEMYPDGFATKIDVGGPGVGLETDFRPHFFGGVATVVGKLLIQCAPDTAIFGEKDFQQLKVVAALARDLDLPVKIVGAPIVREKDGLAMSSRNTYLSADERRAAPVLYRTLKESAARLVAGDALPQVLDEGGAAIEQAGFTLDYFEARHADSLAKVESIRDTPIRLLVAARIGKTRLIDNIAV